MKRFKDDDKRLKTVLITGSSGLIGISITERLLSCGFNVIGTDSIPNSIIGKPCYSFIHSSIEDKDKLIRIMKGSRINVLVHAACTADNGFPYNISPEQKKISASTDRYIYKTAIKSGIKVFILLSSHHVYGIIEKGVTVNETFSTNPFTDYGKTKLASEKTLIKTVKKPDTAYIIARLCPVYSKEYTINLQSVLDSDCNENDGENHYSFCLLDNIADFTAGILKLQSISDYNGVYNVCDAKPFSTDDIAEDLKQMNISVTKMRSDYVYDTPAVYDNSKARRIGLY